MRVTAGWLVTTSSDLDEPDPSAGESAGAVEAVGACGSVGVGGASSASKDWANSPDVVNTII